MASNCCTPNTVYAPRGRNWISSQVPHQNSDLRPASLRQGSDGRNKPSYDNRALNIQKQICACVMRHPIHKPPWRFRADEASPSRRRIFHATVSDISLSCSDNFARMRATTLRMANMVLASGSRLIWFQRRCSKNRCARSRTRPLSADKAGKSRQFSRICIPCSGVGASTSCPISACVARPNALAALLKPDTTPRGMDLKKSPVPAVRAHPVESVVAPPCVGALDWPAPIVGC